MSWFPSTQVEDVPEEASYPEPEPAPMEGQTPTTPKEREKLARRFGRDIGTLIRNMQRPPPPYPDDADAIRAGIEKITDAEGQEEMLRAWRGSVDGDPKRRRSFASGWTAAACSMHRRPWTPHHPRNPRENPLPEHPGSPPRPLLTPSQSCLRLWDQNPAGRRPRYGGPSAWAGQNDLVRCHRGPRPGGKSAPASSRKSLTW